MQTEQQPLKQKSNYQSKVVRAVCVCTRTHLVQVCLAACAETPLASVSLSGRLHLLLESAQTAQMSTCFYCVFALCEQTSPPIGASLPV